MSKKRDPIIAVLNYFENAELPLAQQGLALAQQIVRRRGPQSASTRRQRPKPKPRDTEDGSLSSLN